MADASNAASGAAQGAATGATVGSIVPGIGTVIGGIVGGVGGLLGGLGGNDSSGQARDAQNIANQIIQEIGQAPDISKPLLLEKYKQAGILTPEMEQYVVAAQPKAASVKTDQQFKDAQMQALQQIGQRAQGGLTAADRAGLNQARLQAQGDTQSKIAQIQQQAAQRGQAGMGSDLAAQLSATQGGANEESSAADRLAMQSQNAAQQAAGQLGQMGSQMQQQQFGQEYQKANAADEMNRFNVNNQIAQQQRNVQASNKGQMANLANAQNVSNQNVGAQNQELNNQTQRAMQQYNANKDTSQIKAGRESTTGQNNFNYDQGNAQSRQNSVGGMAGMAGNLISMLHDGGQVHDYRDGGKVSGQAQVPGDHPSNDTVKAMLSPQEIVVPRSLADSKLGRELVKLIKAHNSVKHRLNQED